LCGQTENEALEFLYVHNATHLLIDSTDIGKYSAYSSIGSDENYDRYSQISTFIEDERRMQETKNGTLHVYLGSMFLDQDYSWQKDNEKEFLPAYRTGIGGVILKMNNENVPEKADAVFVYQGRQFNIPLRHVYFKGKLYDFGDGYSGCLYIIPRVINQGQGISINNIGSGLFLTEKTMKALWVKLYLFNEGKNFKLVHKEQDFVVENLKYKLEYLEKAYPESVRIAKDVF